MELSVLKHFLVFCLFVFSSPKQPHVARILALFSSFVVSWRCVVCPKYLNFVTFSIFPDQLVYHYGLQSLSCILSFPCVSLSQLSNVQSSDCLNVFPFALFFR